MKKLIALTLMVACLACFSLGCKKPAPPTPTPDATQQADDETPAETPAGGAPATPEAE
ncbi:MAG: hypothetical protein FWH27_08065 [Planctomycetaceae bacterium]|nr:hypothetical protein [Planctomycetaceae bacterium]